MTKVLLTSLVLVLMHCYRDSGFGSCIGNGNLWVNKNDVPGSTKELFETHPAYRELATQFIAKGITKVGNSGLLYIMQTEMAVTGPNDKSVTVLGSQDATTCVIVIFRHTGSGAVGLAHFDGTETVRGVTEMVKDVKELTEKVGSPNGKYELSLIGGVIDEDGQSQTLVHNILSAFKQQQVDTSLVLACVRELNTEVKNKVSRPILYGAGVNVKTGEIFPASFSIPDMEPEYALRNSRMFTGPPKILNVYDHSQGVLKFTPSDFDDNSFNRENYKPEEWLQWDDAKLLQDFSTTPKVEPKYYIKQFRRVLTQIKDHPYPAKTYFKGNKPLIYRRGGNTGVWTFERN